MSEEIKNAQQLLEEARAAFQGTRYTNASVLFDQAAALDAENLEAPMYAVVCRFLAGECSGTQLMPVWEQIRVLLENVIARGSAAEAFTAAEEVKKALSICTAAVYRSCNERQKAEYANLNKDVKLENKEYIFDEIRRVLLEADEEYKVCLKVMYDYARLVSALPGQEEAPESFFVAVLSYIQMAADLQQECNQEKLFSPLDLGRFACALKLGEEMNEALPIRNAILQTILQGEEALRHWDEFAPYAAKAGILREKVERKVKWRQFLEKLKFWKRMKEAVNSKR